MFQLEKVAPKGPTVLLILDGFGYRKEKKGNAIKLTMTDLIEEDQRCYNKIKALDHRKRLRQRDWKIIDPGLSGWDLYVPL